MMQRSLGMVLMGLALTGAAEPASTCIFIPPLLHRVDAALQRNDAAAPGRPVIVAVDAFRRHGMTCTRQSCVQNSCGSTGTVRIDLAPSADDATPPSELGYRLQLVRGELPASLQGMVGVTVAGGRPLYLRPGFDELPALDVELAAVAVDAAGNESEPSEPFGVRFDGCTLAAVGDRCEEELDPDTDLSAVFEESMTGDGASDALPPSLGAGCSLARRSAPVPVLALLVMSLSLAVRRWSRRGSVGVASPRG